MGSLQKMLISLSQFWSLCPAKIEKKNNFDIKLLGAFVNEKKENLQYKLNFTI